MNLRRKVLGAAVLVAATAPMVSGQIVTSPHDFSSKGWSGGEICKPCHTPHFAIADVPRLWNHTLTTAAYTMHEGAGTAVDDLDIVSRMCMSCHDGTVALDAFGGSPGSGVFIDPGENIGTDLTDDHPVGSEAQYPPAVKPSWWDFAFRPETTTAFSSSVQYNGNSLPLKEWDDSGTPRWVVGCTTCHEPHNEGNHGNGAMLQVSNASSGLCLTCHIK